MGMKSLGEKPINFSWDDTLHNDGNWMARFSNRNHDAEYVILLGNYTTEQDSFHLIIHHLKLGCYKENITTATKQRTERETRRKFR